MMSGNAFQNNKLALLSLSAAYEIDLKLADAETMRPTVLRDLGESLTRVSGMSSAQSTAFLHSDPTTTEVFARAVEESSDAAVTDLDELTSAMQRIITPLTSREREPSKEELTVVKSFCLALHRTLMANTMPSLVEWDSIESEIAFA